MNRKLKLAVAAGAAILAAGPAFAHPEHFGAGGLAHGLLHPLTGADHLAAMLAVGIWSALAARNGGRVWLAPLAFVATMLVGAAMGLAHVALPAVEPGIAASVLVLGLLIAFRYAPSGPLGAILIGSFALFHGHAHGVEATGSVAAFIGGFAIVTASVHVAGIGIGQALMRLRLAVPAAGTLIAVAGAFMLGG